MQHIQIDLKYLFITIFSALVLIYSSYNYGYNNGAQEGIDYALDTVASIIDKQIQSEDSSVTKIIMVKNDTVTYYLSNKTILLK